jgi:hypothetical protein
MCNARNTYYSHSATTHDNSLVYFPKAYYFPHNKTQELLRSSTLVKQLIACAYGTANTKGNA